MERSKKIKFLLAAVYLLISISFFWFFFSNFTLDEITSYQFIKNNRDLIINFKENNFAITSIFFFIFTIIWVLMLGFGSPVALLAGFIYGKWVGTLVASFSLTVGSTILYIFANLFLKKLIKEKFEKRFYSLTDKFKKNELFYLLVFRFIGGIPFCLANILPTLFNVKIKNYFFGTLIGIIPSIFIITSLGSGLEKIINKNLEQPSFFDLITSQEIYAPIAGFLFLIVIIFFIKKKF